MAVFLIFKIYIHIGDQHSGFGFSTCFLKNKLNYYSLQGELLSGMYMSFQHWSSEVVCDGVTKWYVQELTSICTYLTPISHFGLVPASMVPPQAAQHECNLMQQFLVLILHILQLGCCIAGAIHTKMYIFSCL